MHRRSIIVIVLVAVLAVTGITVGLLETRAQGEPQLATIAPAQLLAGMAQHVGDTVSVSGTVSWKNDVLGLSALSFNGQGLGGITSLLASGSGRVWAQGGKFRFEIQGLTGDTTVVGDQNGVVVYDSSTNAATVYAPNLASSAAPSTTTTTAVSKIDPVAAINAFVQKMAPVAVLAVSGREMVAGQTCYVLSLVPKAPNTIFGSIQVAVASKTYLPLKIEVYAKGSTTPVLSAGFTSVSYSNIADSTLTFTPPVGVTVTYKTLSLPAMLAGRAGDGSTTSSTTPATEQAPLDLAEAATQAGFTLLTPQLADADLPFSGAYVIPAKQVDMQSLLSNLGSSLGGLGGLAGLGKGGAGATTTVPSASGDTTTTSPSAAGKTPATWPSSPVTLGPTVVLHYGQGFGSVILVEAKIPPQLISQLEQLLTSVPLLSRTTVAGGTVYQFNTALSSVVLWDKDGLLLVAAGSVSQSDLMGFASNVR